MVYIVTFNQSDLEQVIHCLSHAFTQETMSKALDIDTNSYITLVTGKSNLLV